HERLLLRLALPPRHPEGDRDELPRRGQETALAAPGPLRRPLLQAQLRPAAPGLPPLARQPPPQCAHQVVVRQLVAPRRGGRAGAALNVSSRKVTPTPSVPPTALRVAGSHGLPLTISANRLRRTGMTLASRASPATARPRKSSCAEAGSPSGNAPNARPNAASTLRAWRGSNRSTAAELWPSTSGTSSSRMKRVVAIQKSSRTRTSAW